MSQSKKESTVPRPRPSGLVEPTTSVRKSSPHNSPSIPRKQSVGKASVKKTANNRDSSLGASDNVDVVSSQSTPSVVVRSRSDPKKCPCGISKAGRYMVDCSRCSQLWHDDCLSLNGLKGEDIAKMVDYLCPFCYVAPVRTEDRDFTECFTCRNTDILRKANHDLEISLAATHLNTITSSLRSLDLEKLSDSISKVSDFDTHLQHLLLDHEAMKEHQATTKRLETLVKGQMVIAASTPPPCPQIAALEDLVKELASLTKTLDYSDSTDSNIVKLEGLVGKLDAHVQTSEALEELVGKLNSHTSVADSSVLDSQITTLEGLIGKLDGREQTGETPQSCSHEGILNALTAFEDNIKDTIQEQHKHENQLGNEVTPQSSEPIVQELKAAFMTELAKVTSTTEVLSTELKNVNTTITSLNSEVDSLRTTTQEVAAEIIKTRKIGNPLKGNSSPSEPKMFPNTRAASAASGVPKIHHGLKPHEEILLDVISTEEREKLTAYLEEHHGAFKPTRGRKVLLYGAEYSYPGSDDIRAEPTPEIIKPILEKVNDLQKDIYNKCFPDAVKYNRPAPTINACLINRYDSPDSFIPEHQDDEDTIHPESSIFTLSLGAPCTIKFREITTEEESSLHCPDRSIYTMSRKSQSFFKHRLDKGGIPTGQGVRFSLTFRSVGWQNKNSTCLIGDSNSGHLNFGDQKLGSFGAAMPGKRFFAPRVGDIDPRVCVGYRHIVLLCGTNNLKQPAVRREEDVRGILSELRTKVKQIQELTPKSLIYLCPVLPTKDDLLNEKVFHYCKMIKYELISEFSGVRFVPGFDRFLDSTEKLSRDLSRPVDRNGNRDILHLNAQGTRVLASLIKEAVLGQRDGGRNTRSRNQSHTQGTTRDRVAG